MLKNAVVCVLLAATAAMAWENLQDVPSPAVVENGAHITYGAANNRIWGVFPTSTDEATYAAYYSLSGSPGWTVEDEYGFADYMTNTSITYQWLEGGVLFVMGNEDGDPVIYSYNESEEAWDSDDLPFNLGAGASIAYVPNGGYNAQMNPVPGRLYCLPGGSADFWCYEIPTSLPNVPLNGIYPGQGAVIAQPKPLFQWDNTASPQYRLLVSTNLLFSDTVLDEVISSPEFTPTTALANGMYHWRSATWATGMWSWSGTHNFEIVAGWSQLNDDVPYSVGAGAAIAYDADAYGHRSILAFLGGGGYYFYEYNINQPGWNPKDATDWPQNAGTSLSTPEPTGEGHHPWASFYGQGTDDKPYYLNVHATPPVWTLFEPNDSKFLETVGSDASMITVPPNLYLVVGDNNFYKVDPPGLGFEGGMDAGVVRPADHRAHVTTRYDAVEVEYQLAAASHVRATLHDAVGRQVSTFDVGEQTAGIHRLSWDRDASGIKLSAGAYFVVLDMGAEQATLKAVVR